MRNPQSWGILRWIHVAAKFTGWSFADSEMIKRFVWLRHVTLSLKSWIWSDDVLRQKNNFEVNNFKTFNLNNLSNNCQPSQSLSLWYPRLRKMCKEEIHNMQMLMKNSFIFKNLLLHFSGERNLNHRSSRNVRVAVNIAFGVISLRMCHSTMKWRLEMV